MELQQVKNVGGRGSFSLDPRPHGRWMVRIIIIMHIHWIDFTITQFWNWSSLPINFKWVILAQLAMATLRDGRVPKNNLQEHLARYKSTNRENSSSIATSQPERKSVDFTLYNMHMHNKFSWLINTLCRKSFTFYKVTAPSSGSLTTGFTPPFKPNGGHTKPTQSIPNTVPSFWGR